ncbi:MAG: hypothetical protein DRH26_12045 [Deltaproteobacteria bacterium]|nr:MAG: hypothetical protein DRH26_12045 [Deltaproteobacteria bacterium]
MFVSTRDACLGQMAAAFLKDAVKGRILVLTAGMDAAKAVDPDMVKVMAEKNLDLAYRVPQSLDGVLAGMNRDPHRVIFIGPKETTPDLSCARVETWNIVTPAIPSLEAVRKIRDEIELRVKTGFPSP